MEIQHRFKPGTSRIQTQNVTAEITCCCGVAWAAVVMNVDVLMTFIKCPEITDVLPSKRERERERECVCVCVCVCV